MSFIRRTFSFILALGLSAGAVCISAFAVSSSASSAILMDAESSRVLYEQNIHEKRPIASITKLLTALVAVELAEDLDRSITVSPECVGIEGSSIYLQAGEKVGLRELLYGLLLQSGNDAASAIAVSTAGSVESFVTLMNRRAEELGMDNSHFSNPSGLNCEDHYSTAYDMALLACACLKNEVVAEICATKTATFGSRTFVNHNKLLHRYEGCIGMKTGYTESSGRTLVSAAERDGQILVCVTLNDPQDWEDHETLLDYGFSSSELYPLCRKGEPFGSAIVLGSLNPIVRLVAGDDLKYPLLKGETLELQIEITQHQCAPIPSGTALGRAIWLLNGVAVSETDLLSVSDIRDDINRKKDPWQRLKEFLQ